MVDKEKESALKNINTMRASTKQVYDKCKNDYIPIILNPNNSSSLSYQDAKKGLNNTLDSFYNIIMQNLNLLEEAIIKKELPKNEK